MRMRRDEGFTLDYEVGRSQSFRLGSFRPFLGAVFGLVIYFALESGLLQIAVPDSNAATDATDVSLYFLAFIAFVAGFSERLAQVVLGKAERTVAATFEQDDGEMRQTRAVVPERSGGRLADPARALGAATGSGGAHRRGAPGPEARAARRVSGSGLLRGLRPVVELSGGAGDRNREPDVGHHADLSAAAESCCFDMRKSSGMISARTSPSTKTRTTELWETTTASAGVALVIEAPAAWRVPSPGRKSSGSSSTST